MILFSFKNKKEDRGETYPCSDFRWTLQCGWDGIGFVHQHRYKGVNAWYNSHTSVYALWWSLKHFRFGTEHVYYDGPHCFLDLGVIHIQWQNWHCKKCK